MRVRLCDVFLGGVFWVALFERERDIYLHHTKIHSLNDGGAKMKKRLFLLPISRRSKEGKRRVIIKSHIFITFLTQKGGGLFLSAPFYYSFILLFPASFLFFFVGLVLKPHV